MKAKVLIIALIATVALVGITYAITKYSMEPVTSPASTHIHTPECSGGHDHAPEAEEGHRHEGEATEVSGSTDAEAGH